MVVLNNILRKTIAILSCIAVLTGLFIHMIPPQIVGAEEFSSDIAPKDFYDTYGTDVIFNETDNSIYWALRGSSKNYGAATSYTRKGIRYGLSGTSYYVDTASDDSAYNNNLLVVIGDYYYMLSSVKLATILELFAEKYPGVSFSEYFNGKYTIEIDGLMAIRVKNVSQYYDDLTDGNSPRGVLASAQAGKEGKSAYWGLHSTPESIHNAYLPYNNVNFESWYDRLIDITPSNPAADIDYDIKVDPLTLTGEKTYKYDNTTYYVKALTDFSLEFASRTYQGGVLKANATCQPSVNGIVSLQNLSENYRNVPVYRYFTSPFGAGASTYTISDTYALIYSMTDATQKRSNDLTTLSTKVTMQLDEMSYVPRFAGMSRLMIGGSVAKSVMSSYINVIPDGTPPVISGLTAPESWIRADNYIFNINTVDNLSGVHNIEVYADNILVDSTTDSNTACKLTGQGEHLISVKSYDNVGNVGESRITLKLDNEPPSINVYDLYEFGEEDATGDLITIDIPVSDWLSGVEKVNVYDKNGTLIAYKNFIGQTNEEFFGVTIDGLKCVGDFKNYTIEAFDVAGNSIEKVIAVKYNKKMFVKPDIVGTH